MRLLSLLMVVLIVVAPAPLSVFSAEITTGSDDPQKIAERGQTASGCQESPSRTRESVVGRWLALTDTAVQPTSLFVIRAKVLSDNPAEKYYFKDIPLRVGSIVKAQVGKRRVNTTARTEYDIRLGTSRYRFTEWGGGEFALATVSSSGKIVRTEIFGSDGKVIPPDAYVVTTKARDEYDPGSISIVNAGDFNGDGIVDLLLRYKCKEAGGLELLLSDPKSGKHLDPIVSATEYSDCGSP